MIALEPMQRFAHAVTNSEFGQRSIAQLPWNQNITKIKDLETRNWHTQRIGQRVIAQLQNPKQKTPQKRRLSSQPASGSVCMSAKALERQLEGIGGAANGE